jgi:hypothetical protein
VIGEKKTEYERKRQAGRENVRWGKICNMGEQEIRGGKKDRIRQKFRRQMKCNGRKTNVGEEKDRTRER